MPWGYTGIFELENGGGLFGTSLCSSLSSSPPPSSVLPWFPSSLCRRLTLPHSEGVPIARRQSDLGLPRRLRLLATHPRRALRGRLAPRPDRHRALAGPPRYMERARGRAHRAAAVRGRGAPRGVPARAGRGVRRAGAGGGGAREGVCGGRADCSGEGAWGELRCEQTFCVLTVVWMIGT